MTTPGQPPSPGRYPPGPGHPSGRPGPVPPPAAWPGGSPPGTGPWPGWGPPDPGGPGSWPEPPERDRPPRTLANWLLAGLVAAVGLLAFVLAVTGGRADTALLFVGLPSVLAVALALTPVRTGHGRVFALTTVALLLAAVALHEGAICVLLAAPLVYAVAHGVTALVTALRQGTRAHALVLLPLLVVAGTEGAVPQWRVAPEQRVVVTRVVALPPDEVATRLAAGPRPVPVRSVPLRLLGVPMPEQVTGDGLDPGDRWMFGYHGSTHGPGGHLLAEVTQRGPETVRFRFVENSSITGRWLRWEQAQVSWREVGPGRTEVTVAVDYQRRLDPSWYFGPLTDALLDRGVGHLMDMMILR